MSAGFTYGLFVEGADTRSFFTYPDSMISEKLLPNSTECGFGGIALDEDGWTAPETVIKCRSEQMSQHTQPGENSFYGYDYDILGMVLGRAYDMDPETLMREKLWTPLKMTSAMFQAQKGDKKLKKVVEIHFRVPDEDDLEHAKNYTAPRGLRANEWHWASSLRDEEWESLQASSLGSHMSPFSPAVTADGIFRGVSGYGGGSMATLDDYGKFLQMICKRGEGPDGTRVMGPTAWKWLMSPTLNPDSPGLKLSHTSVGWGYNWHFGYAKARSGIATTDTGAQYDGDAMMTATSQYAGIWGGYFGTTYNFDVDTGLYWVGGEQTLSSSTGQPQRGRAFVSAHGSAWLASMTAGSAVFDKPPYSSGKNNDDDDADDDDRGRGSDADDVVDDDAKEKDPQSANTNGDDDVINDDDGEAKDTSNILGRPMDNKTAAEIQVELKAFADGNSNHGISYLGGNANTNEQVVVSAGCAQKMNAEGTGCTPVGADTIFRLASMTKIMGAAVAAIAFEEGVVKPGDSIAEWIPEFSNLSALTKHAPDATHSIEWWSIEPLHRNITFWDLLGMQGGFAYGFLTAGSDARKAFYYPDKLVMDTLKEHVFECGDFNLGSRNNAATPEEWIACWAENIDQMAQPGTKPLYGYDYGKRRNAQPARPPARPPAYPLEDIDERRTVASVIPHSAFRIPHSAFPSRWRSLLSC